MERRELYDPEDIEQLLLERAYDDLLEEERAFVLRHLTGREEYEAMRALLLRVHDDDAGSEDAGADPAVREHLLNVFRAEQRPQWRIWLNSVPSWLLPREASAMWRPALAIASLAAIIMITVVATRDREGQGTQLAVLQESKNEAKQGTTPAPPATKEPASTEAPKEIAQPKAAAADRSEQSAGRSAMGTNGTADGPSSVFDAGAPAKEPADLAAEQQSAAETLWQDEERAHATNDSVGLGSTALGAAPASHAVTADELMLNASLAAAEKVPKAVTSATGATRDRSNGEKRKMKADAAVDLDDRADATASNGQDLIGLLRAAW